MKPQSSVVAPLVAVVLLVSAWFAPDKQVVHADRPAVSVSVGRTSYACPLLSGGAVTAGQVVAGTSATATVISADSHTATDALDTVDQWRTARFGTTKSPRSVVVTQLGRGSGAVGFSTGKGSSGQGAGAANARCSAATSLGWFLGLGAVDGHNSALQLTNLGTEPAVVDLDLFDSDGQVTGVNTEGVVIAPNSSSMIALSKLAAGENDLAVRVTGERGLAGVQVLDSLTGNSKGTEWQAPSSAGRSLLLTGADPGGSHVLKVANPGKSTANVVVRAVGPGGSFAVEGLADLTVPPGTQRSINLPSRLSLKNTALSLTADVQIAAVVRSSNGADIDFGQSAVVLDQQTAVPIGSLGTSLLLTVPGRKPASVRVQVMGVNMTQLGSSTLSIKAGTSVALDPATIAKGGAYALLTPSGGDVYGAARFSTGKQITSFPLAPAPVTATAPSVTMP